MLQPDERESLERAFREAEASLFLSGLSPSENCIEIRARILSGEITFDKGQEEILAYYRVKKPSMDQARS